MGKKLILLSTIWVSVTALAVPVLAEDSAKPQPDAAQGGTVTDGSSVTAAASKDQHNLPGVNAIEKASQLGKYTFIFFYRDENPPTEQLRAVFDGAVGKMADRAESIVVQVDNPSEKEIVDRFAVRAAPMPFVFVVAPNGAVVRSYRSAFSEQQLLTSFASPGLEKALKALQDGKMTFLSIQNAGTKFDAEAMQGVNEFKSDPKYGATTEVITIDPGDSAEAGFLQNLKVDPNTPEAVTVLLAPPGNIVGTFKGATEKNVLLASVQDATKKKPCCAGKKGGCGPKAKKD